MNSVASINEINLLSSLNSLDKYFSNKYKKTANDSKYVKNTSLTSSSAYSTELRAESLFSWKENAESRKCFGINLHFSSRKFLKEYL